MSSETSKVNKRDRSVDDSEQSLSTLKKLNYMCENQKSKRPRTGGVTAVWFMEPYTMDISRVRLDEESAIYDFLEHIIDEGYLQQWENAKPKLFTVKHKGVSLPQRKTLKDIMGITMMEPLILELTDDTKKLLDSYMLPPSDRHDAGSIKYIIPEAKGYRDFIDIVKSLHKPLHATSSTVNLPNLGVFSFQRNENSVQVRVALLLFMAFGSSTNVTVVPSLDIELPFKKRGPSYQSDFVIMTKEGTPIEAAESSSSSTTGMVVYQSNVPAIIIEVKTVVPVDFESVKAHDCIEMLIYCLYIMRIEKLHAVLGCITDGKTWHVLRITKIDNGLSVNSYMTFSSFDEKVISSTIPSLLACL